MGTVLPIDYYGSTCVFQVRRARRIDPNNSFSDEVWYDTEETNGSDCGCFYMYGFSNINCTNGFPGGITTSNGVFTGGNGPLNTSAQNSLGINVGECIYSAYANTGFALAAQPCPGFTGNDSFQFGFARGARSGEQLFSGEYDPELASIRIVTSTINECTPQNNWRTQPDKIIQNPNLKNKGL